MPHEHLASYAADFVVLRRLLTEGEEAVARGEDVSVRVGLLQVDLAAELLLKVGLRFYSKRPDPNSELSRLIEAVNVAAERKVVDDAHALLTLRKMRNTVMHDGIQQEPGTAHTNAVRARNALMRAAAEIFGVDLANLHLGEFISSERVRDLLTKAAKYFDSQQYREAVGYALAAFEQLMSAWTAFNQRLFDLGEPPSDKFARIIGTLIRACSITQSRWRGARGMHSTSSADWRCKSRHD